MDLLLTDLDAQLHARLPTYQHALTNGKPFASILAGLRKLHESLEPSRKAPVMTSTGDSEDSVVAVLVSRPERRQGLFDPGPLPPQTALSGERWGPSSRRSSSARRGDPIRRSFRATRLPPQTVLSGEPSFSWAHMVVVATILQTGEGMGSSRRRPLALSCRTDGPNNYQIIVSSTSLPVARTDATAEVLIAVAKQPGGGQPH